MDEFVKKRILSKFSELDSYLDELDSIKPNDFEDYTSSIKKRSCERLLQISIEVVIDICNLLNSNLKLGIPNDEEDIFNQLKNKKVISKSMAEILSDMKGLRNILVHKYGVVNDELIFEVIEEKIDDFGKFKKEILAFLDNYPK